ncbi:nickel-dependent lactate racemase [Veillonella caviae]|uniref:nickel-dependent lactate racemase n=1 Tax=Veillonella caviae TaxID=248316 RepID=UPI0023A84E45|nr:nickel-dependent lactate racemase [Veillonella caviae]MCI5707939.1 nickel-dependent lactate racemase [Veillonella caviae]MDY5408611.1 nickel-dependent lactate racemase [Veillonella caviae]MDY5715324.1 nickel-dependent lactate racemase [Veillonella caviae]
MREFVFPYDCSSKSVSLDEALVRGVLESNATTYEPTMTPAELVEYALDHPINSPSLESLVEGKQNMVIITSDHTRPMPSKVTLPILLRRIRTVNPTIDITILIATGFHRAMTHEEMVTRFGEELVNTEKFINHDAEDADNMVEIGILPSGGKCVINRLAVETELLISEGLINPHFFAGFSGGRKSVLPGVASKVTVLANHCAEFIESEHSRTGIIDENPIHKDMLYAARTANLQFILNVVIDNKKEIIKAVAGDCVDAHKTGYEFIRSLSSVKRIPADIVITSNGGYPSDQNIYQSVKGMTAAEASCNDGGVIILVASCKEGHGGQALYDAMKNMVSPAQILQDIHDVPRNETKPYQWKIQILARILNHFSVIVVTDDCDHQILQDMHMIPATTLGEALVKARQLKGEDASITIIPNGVSVIVEP